MQIKQGEAGLRNVYPVARMRLEAALTASGETLPGVTALIEMEMPKPEGEAIEELQARVKAALDEVTGSLVAVREAARPSAAPAA